MQAILQRRRHAEVAPTAANGPEQIGPLILAGMQCLPFGADEFDALEVVEREAVLSHQPAKTAAEGEARDSRAGNDTAGDGQAVLLCRAIELGPGDASLRARDPGLGVDIDALHRR